MFYERTKDFDQHYHNFMQNLVKAEENRIESTNKLDEIIVMEKYLVDDQN